MASGQPDDETIPDGGFDLISRISEGSILCGEYLPPEGELQLAAPGITDGDIGRICTKINQLKGASEGLRYIPGMELTYLIADRCPITAVHTMLTA